MITSRCAGSSGSGSGEHVSEKRPGSDPFEGLLNPVERRLSVPLTAHEPTEVTLRYVPRSTSLGETAALNFTLGHREPQLHQRQQRMTARQVLAVFAGLGGQVECLLDGACPPVGERCRNHDASCADWPSLAAASTARTML